jgi:DNA-binding protein WhiA
VPFLEELANEIVSNQNFGEFFELGTGFLASETPIKPKFTSGKSGQKELTAFVSGVVLSSASGDEQRLWFSFKNYENAKTFCEILAEFDILTVLKSQTVMISGFDCVRNLVALVSARKILLEMENENIIRGVRADANRRANCDIANTAKTTKSALEFIEKIQELKRDGKFDLLTKKQRAVCDAREKNPYATLAELAEILNITKSGLVNRIREVYKI